MRKIPATRDRPYGTQDSKLWEYSSRARTRRAWVQKVRKSKRSGKEHKDTDKNQEHGRDKVGQEKEEKKNKDMKKRGYG